MDTESLRLEVQRDVAEVTREYHLGHPASPFIEPLAPQRDGSRILERVAGCQGRRGGRLTASRTIACQNGWPKP